jgi:hypothetical protein
MYEATRIDLGVEDRASLSRKRILRAIGAAVCCMAVLACAVSGFPRQNSSDILQVLQLNLPYASSPADELLQADAPVPVAASVRDFLSSTSSRQAATRVEQAHPAKDSGVAQPARELAKQAAQLHMLEQIAHSVQVQVAKLKGEKGKNVRLTFKPDETAARANSIAAEAKTRYLELHKKVQAASSPSGASRSPASIAAAHPSAASALGTANQDDLNAMATKADDAAASAIDAADEQRVVVARQASTYLKAEKRALVVQEKAQRAEAKADTARALVEDAAAKNAEAHAKVFRRRAARASAKASKYAEQIKTLNDDWKMK